MNPDTHHPPVLVHPRRLLVATALALIALALGARTATAATPIDLGPANEGPGLALDASGAAHLSWAAPGGAYQALHYCRVDRGGSGCATAHTFPQVGTFQYDFGNAPLLVSGGAVDVLDARFDGIEQKHLWTSANNFAAPTVVGSNAINFGTMAFTDALYLPKGSISNSADVVATILGGVNSNGASFQASGLSGVTEGSAVLSPGSTTDATIGRYGSSLVAVYVDLDSSSRPISWRRYTGVGTPASLNTGSNWTAGAPIAAGDVEVDLAEGAGGLYLAYQGPSDELLLTRFNGLSGWEAPLTLAPNASEISAFEDPTGVVHLVWLDPPAGELHYSYGLDPSNTKFSRPQTLNIGQARETDVATDAAGIGWVTWRAENGEANAIPVEPGEPPLPPAGGGAATGTPTAPTAPPKPPAAAPTAPGPTATKSKTVPVVPGLNATLSTPKACVAGGAAFQAKVAVKRNGSKAHKLSYSVKQVKFFSGGKLLATDTKKPFEATLRGSARAGTSLPIAAKISVVLKKGHRHSTVTKSLTAKVVTCG